MELLLSGHFFFTVDLSHVIKFFFLIRFEVSGIKRIPDLFHHRIVEIKVMQYTQTHSKHFFCFQQMADVGSLTVEYQEKYLQVL